MGNSTVSEATVQQPDDARAASANSLASLPDRIKEYIAELQAEMRKVTWPTWTQVRATTAVVLAAIFGFAAYFFIVDALLSAGIDRLFKAMAK